MPEFTLPGMAELLGKEGVSDAGVMALFVGEQPVGGLAFLMTAGRKLPPGEYELVEAIGRKTAVAMRLVNLAAASRQAAVSAERERAATDRLHELAAANRVLVESLDGFSMGLSLDAFVAHVMRQVGDVLHVPAVELWHVTAGGSVVYPGPLLRDGRLLTPEEAGNPLSVTGYPVPTSYNLVNAVDQRRHIICEQMSNHPDVPPAVFGWYAHHLGVDKMINLPLVAGRRVIGAVIGFAPAGHTHTDSQLEIGHALASQLALALQLGELSQQARSVAVLEAKEHAASDRAAELERLNAILTRGAERVGAANDLAGVVVGFLHEAKAVTGSFCAAAYRSIGATRHVPLGVIVGDAALSPEEIAASPLFAGYEEWSARDEGGLFARLAAGEAVYQDVRECEPCLSPEAAAYHRSAGNVMVWHLPLTLG
ncbi:MAG: GAF domain-containing protein, partial [Gemmataceae bacterium]|nr:GAF domain-containing protein [Gemmataceae bacterium]